MRAARPLWPRERGAGMPQGTIPLGSPGGSASRTSASPLPGAVPGPVVLPRFRVFLGGAGCGTDLANRPVRLLPANPISEAREATIKGRRRQRT